MAYSHIARNNVENSLVEDFRDEALTAMAMKLLLFIDSDHSAALLATVLETVQAVIYK